MTEPLYIYFMEGYRGPVVTTEIRDGLMFDTTPDNRLVGIEVLDYDRLTVGGVSPVIGDPGALVPDGMKEPQ